MDHFQQLCQIARGHPKMLQGSELRQQHQAPLRSREFVRKHLIGARGKGGKGSLGGLIANQGLIPV